MKFELCHNLRHNLRQRCVTKFRMNYNDFIRTFTHIEAVHLDPETARDEPSIRAFIPWTSRAFHGAWQKGVTAGGCRNNTGQSEFQ